jgi:hypothetical protein
VFAGELLEAQFCGVKPLVRLLEINFCAECAAAQLTDVGGEGPERSFLLHGLPCSKALSASRLHADPTPPTNRGVNPIKNPAEHHKDEATGPEQRRGLSVSQAIGDNKDQAIAFHNRGVERLTRGLRDT